MRDTQELIAPKHSEAQSGTCPLVKAQFYWLRTICFGLWASCSTPWIVLSIQLEDGLQLTESPANLWLKSHEKPQMITSHLRHFWIHDPQKSQEISNCGGKPLCLEEICCTTIITVTDFGTKSGVLLKQKPKMMVIAVGLDGEWKLEGPWGDCQWKSLRRLFLRA